jgi:UDP-N-acetylmuramoyl-L-alanine---L-glutamate ligase
VSSLKNILLFSETGLVLQKILGEDTRVHWVETLEQGIALAKKMTREGGTCVFSPAAPSYNQFLNFEERGEAFKRLVSRKG